MSNLQLVLGFCLNFSAALFIIRGIYYPIRRRKEYVLAFLTLNTSVFLISSLLGGIDLSVGFGFSLFAIFSVLSYRTNPIPVREMTYLFVLMSLPVIDAVLLRQSQDLIQLGRAPLIDIQVRVWIGAGQEIGPPVAIPRLISLKLNRVHSDAPLLLTIVGRGSV